MDMPDRSKHLESLQATLDYLGENEIHVDLHLQSGRVLTDIYIVKVGKGMVLGDHTTSADGKRFNLSYFYAPLSSIESVQSFEPVDAGDTEFIAKMEME